MLASTVMDDAARSMAGIFTKTNICNHEGIRRLRLKTAHCLLDDALIGVSLRTDFIFLAWNTKEKNCGYTKLRYTLRLTPEILHRPLHYSRHGGDLTWGADTLCDKKWINELINVQMRFPDKAAQLIILARAA